MARTATVQCPTCQAIRFTPMEQYVVGEVLRPFPGGGSYGRCLRCKRTGLKVIKIPKISPTKPVGWRKVPEG